MALWVSEGNLYGHPITSWKTWLLFTNGYVGCLISVKEMLTGLECLWRWCKKIGSGDGSMQASSTRKQMVGL